MSSDEWIDKMKEKTSLVYRSVKVYSKIVDLQKVQVWKSKSSEIKSVYQHKDVLKINECKFLYNILLDKTCAIKFKNVMDENAAKKDKHFL